MDGLALVNVTLHERLDSESNQRGRWTPSRNLVRRAPTPTAVAVAQRIAHDIVREVSA